MELKRSLTTLAYRWIVPEILPPITHWMVWLTTPTHRRSWPWIEIRVTRMFFSGIFILLIRSRSIKLELLCGRSEEHEMAKGTFPQTNVKSAPFCVKTLSVITIFEKLEIWCIFEFEDKEGRRTRESETGSVLIRSLLAATEDRESLLGWFSGNFPIGRCPHWYDWNNVSNLTVYLRSEKVNHRHTVQSIDGVVVEINMAGKHIDISTSDSQI